MKIEATTKSTTSIKYIYTPEHTSDKGKPYWLVYCTRNDRVEYTGALGKSPHSLQLAIDDAERQLDELVAKRAQSGYNKTMPTIDLDLSDLF